MALPRKVRVFIVDDSAVVRQVLQAVLLRDPGIEVLGAAPDPLFALQRMQQGGWPDVLVLDVEMPRMDGITFLKKLMIEHPLPVVICSTLTEKGAQITLDALAAGAVSVVTKPRVGLKDFLIEQTIELTQTIKAAARANTSNLHSAPRPAVAMPGTQSPIPSSHVLHETTEKIIAMGMSTGGTVALERVLTTLPRTLPGIAVVQHMPEKFTATFAERLNSVCALEVREAHDGDRLIPGLVLIAPGGRHMQVRRSGAQYHVEVRDGPPVNRHRPSVDVLFRSVAQCAGRNALGIILTGMGDDGARGLKDMHDAGARTVAQDEASSVVYGMPKEAVKLGAVDRNLPLNDIGPAMADYGRT
ncbi:fused chemotaxis regulator; protein-glutamate methylesterase in two-component regulatory system with CheA [Thiomonas sp. X19]|uniref:protein-glutamate methylesterase/protein-glutamine glutaminase n=1 Tax=Thiomonas sp. X19 TaxID=1050370 RepID=UPI000B6F3F8D|nr:chemotaxis response regulator protein-glutamate methylesterase [Thiomonas sp. X19]SCC91111.1 fused chemotaxis regulator; protein-glutamate methylesterase in two-component regulatory system with CheA [Thiomonas sp. X19]